MARRRRALIAAGGRSVIYSGQAGANIFYTLYSDGQLVFSGSGETYQGSTYPPFQFYEYIKSIVFEEGITKINLSYYDRTYNLGGTQSVFFPSTLVFISSFFLRNLGVHDPIELYFNFGLSDYLKMQGYMHLASIDTHPYVIRYFNDVIEENLVIPNDILVVPAYAFVQENIKSVSSNNAITISNEAFFDSTIEEAILQNVEEIGERAFRRCSNLAAVSMPSVKKIGGYAFSDIKTGAHINIHGSSELVIEANAFCHANGITLDFSVSSGVPALNGNLGATSPTIIVPDALYEEWIAAPVWNAHPEWIKKASEV